MEKLVKTLSQKYWRGYTEEGSNLFSTKEITTEIEPLPSTKYMTTPRPQNDVWNEYLLTQWEAWKQRNKANWAKVDRIVPGKLTWIVKQVQLQW